MSAEKPIPFLFLGNHPCLDFINTLVVMDGRPVELLNTLSDLLRWLAQSRLGIQDSKHIERQWGGESSDTRLLGEARGFRATVREMVEHIVAAKPVPRQAITVLNAHLRSRISYPEVRRRNGRFELEFHADSQDVHQVMTRLAEAASDLLCTLDLSLIRKCRNPACVLLFYDTTKNHTRLWCSMSLCGNRSKVSAHYRRHRQAKR